MRLKINAIILVLMLVVIAPKCISGYRDRCYSALIFEKQNPDFAYKWCSLFTDTCFFQRGFGLVKVQCYDKECRINVLDYTR